MRIRTVKPEWLEDDRLLKASSDARVLSIALILLSDDHGRGRLNLAAAARVFPLAPATFDEALAELAPWFVHEYTVRGQRYFEICNWTKHQKVDRPSKPRVPGPDEVDDLDEPSRDSRDSIASPSRDLREGEVSRLGNVHSRDTRETLASDLDLDPDLDHDRERARGCEGSWLRMFSDAYGSATGLPWNPSTAKAVDRRSFEVWLDALEAKGVDRGAASARVIAGFFADDWAKRSSYPAGAMLRSPGKYYAQPTAAEELVA